MKVTSKKLAIAGAVTTFIGFLIGHTTFFAAYTWDGTGSLSPASAVSECSSTVGQFDNLVNTTSASACASAGDWNTFGAIVIILGVAVMAYALVRYYRSRR